MTTLNLPSVHLYEVGVYIGEEMGTKEFITIEQEFSSHSVLAESCVDNGGPSPSLVAELFLKR